MKTKNKSAQELQAQIDALQTELDALNIIHPPIAYREGGKEYTEADAAQIGGFTRGHNKLTHTVPLVIVERKL